MRRRVSPSAPAAALGPGFGDGGPVRLEGPGEVFEWRHGRDDPGGLGERMRDFCADIPGGGAIAGYIGYDAAAAFEPSLDLPVAPDPLPTISLVRYARRGEGGGLSGGPLRRPSILDHERTGRARFEAQVRAVKAHILRGDCFQANISHRQRLVLQEGCDLALDLYGLMAGEAAYGAVLPAGTGAIVSASPELLLSVSDGELRTEPIKGTAPRGTDSDTDAAFREALGRSEKDRAENLMIVDLMRNDLARVAADHSVREGPLCAVRTLPALHHLYSVVTARLAPSRSPLDALLALFPGGSVTGAPKHRAMQIIAEQEGEGRGVYCGSVVYMPAPDRLTASVAIRTAALFARDEEDEVGLDLRSGGGITYLSDPADEWEETITKSYPLLRLLGEGPPA